MQAFDLAEAFNAPELSKRCALFCLEKYGEMVGGEERLLVATPRSFAGVFQKMAPRLAAAVEEEIASRVERAAA
jgi:hypothetical protein